MGLVFYWMVEQDFRIKPRCRANLQNKYFFSKYIFKKKKPIWIPCKLNPKSPAQQLPAPPLDCTCRSSLQAKNRPAWLIFILRRQALHSPPSTPLTPHVYFCETLTWVLPFLWSYSPMKRLVRKRTHSAEDTKQTCSLERATTGTKYNCHACFNAAKGGGLFPPSALGLN